MVTKPKQKKTATDKLLHSFPHCFMCGAPAETREHMPPKAMFYPKTRPDKFVVPACNECNSDSSTADLIVSLASMWAEDHSEIERGHRRLARQINLKRPDIVNEWTANIGAIRRKRARKHLEREGVTVPPHSEFVTMGPLTIAQMNLFSFKATMAIYFEMYRKPVPESALISPFWRTKEDISARGLPDFLLRMLPQFHVLTQGKYKADQFALRVNPGDNGVMAYFARYRYGFYTGGFVISDGSTLPHEERHKGLWLQRMKPKDFLSQVGARRIQ